MKTVIYTLPDFWAPYFINGDASGMEDAEIDAADDWLAAHDDIKGECLDCTGEPEFRWRHDASEWVLACDCLDYIFPAKD